MSNIERFDEVSKIWKLVLPDVAPPPNGTLFGWLAAFSDEEITRILACMPRRIGNKTMTPDNVYRCVSGMLRDNKRNVVPTREEKTRLLRPEPRGIDFTEAISQVSFKNPQNVARGYVAFVMSEMVRSGLSLSQVRDSVLQDIKRVNEQSVLDAPNLALCSNLAGRIADSLETATGRADGSALKRLKAFEVKVTGVGQNPIRGERE